MVFIKDKLYVVTPMWPGAFNIDFLRDRSKITVMYIGFIEDGFRGGHKFFIIETNSFYIFNEDNIFGNVKNYYFDILI
ncbi:MAG: hypothetical protein AABY22_02200 [Nanoarchaeota archaeon]